MDRQLEIVEFALVIAAPNYDPSLLNPSFLTFSGIVPSQWELARQPVVSQRASQIIYNNGVNLVAQPGRLTFVEALSTKTEETIGISEIAQRYVEALPNLDAQALGINFRGYIPFAGDASGARDYLFKQLLAPGAWQEMGTSPVQAALNFLYTFDFKRLNLSLNEAFLQLPEQEKMPIMLFSGNFDYELSAESLNERRSKLEEILKTWRDDQEIYTEVVNKFAASQPESELVFPTLAHAG